MDKIITMAMIFMYLYCHFGSSIHLESSDFLFDSHFLGLESSCPCLLSSPFYGYKSSEDLFGFRDVSPHMNDIIENGWVNLSPFFLTMRTDMLQKLQTP